MDEHFAKLEKFTQPAFVVRMHNEQNNIRKMVTRAHTIKDTDFVVSACAIVELLTVFIILLMLLTKIELFYEAMLFTALASFIVVYMIYLLRDMNVMRWAIKYR